MNGMDPLVVTYLFFIDFGHDKFYIYHFLGFSSYQFSLFIIHKALDLTI